MEGRGIVSTSSLETLTKASKESKDLEWAGRVDHYFSDERDLLGHTPTPEDVSRVIVIATECSQKGHPEVNWNLEVHQPLLSMAFRPTNCDVLSHLVNFMGSMPAGLMLRYSNSTILKKVDFAIYIEPGNDLDRIAPDDTPMDAINRCLEDLPGKVFNITDFEPLSKRPIALSIETKKPSAAFDSAKLQLGVWQNAHWTFLRHLRDMSSQKCKEAAELQRATTIQQEESTATGTAPATATAEQNVSFALPSFIPGIIVQGHQWYLIITTPEGRRTVLWQSAMFGTTQTTKGVYQIVCVLHLLRQWVRDPYWPLIRDMVRAGWPRPAGEMMVD
ncbi:hypothetical protein E4U41_002573 [Claviceps citrina]|nr:hypothetical protein E4U41_002573 [Claviceps citrina]